MSEVCGRFVATASPDEVARYFEAEGPALGDTLQANYNVAPTDDVYAVYESGGKRRVDAFHWGLVPFWAKDPSVGSRMINARAESLSAKGAYRLAFRERRCLIPADGFYEWQKRPGQKVKQPYFVCCVDGQPVALAGLWEKWRGGAPDQDTLRSCTIITTEANTVVAPLHDRMPVMLPASAWDEWLDRDNDDVDGLQKLLLPAPPDLLTLRPVTTEVNNVRNTGPHLIEEVDPDAHVVATGQASQSTLF